MGGGGDQLAAIGGDPQGVHVPVGERGGDRRGGRAAGVRIRRGDPVPDLHLLDGPGGPVGHEHVGAGREAPEPGCVCDRRQRAGARAGEAAEDGAPAGGPQEPAHRVRAGPREVAGGAVETARGGARDPAHEGGAPQAAHAPGQGRAAHALGPDPAASFVGDASHSASVIVL